MQTIKLKPNATRGDAVNYIHSIVNKIKSTNFSEEQMEEAKKAKYEDGKYYVKTRQQEQLTGTQGYFLMKTLINNLLNTRIEYIDSMILAVALNIKSDNFNIRNIKPLIDSDTISEGDIIYQNKDTNREEFYKLNQRGCNMVIGNTKIRNLTPLKIIFDYYERLDRLTTNYEFDPLTTINEYRSIGSGYTALLRTNINKLERATDNKFSIGYNNISTYIYKILNFGHSYNRTDFDSEKVQMGLTGERTIEESIKIFIIGHIENSISSAIEHVMVNETTNLTTDISFNILEMAILLKDRNPDNTFMHEILNRMDVKPLLLTSVFTPIKMDKEHKIKFHKLSDIGHIIKFTSKHEYLEGNIVIKFGKDKEDVFTTMDAFDIIDTKDGLKHEFTGTLISNDYHEKRMVIYNNISWYQIMMVRMKIGFTDAINFDDRKVKHGKGFMIEMESDERGGNLNLFEVRKILNTLTIINDNVSIYTHASENKQVTFEQLINEIKLYIDKSTDSNKIKYFWIQILLMKFLETGFNFDNIFKLNRKIDASNYPDLYIKSKGEFKLPENIDDIEAKHILKNFTINESTVLSLDNLPFNNGYDDFTTILNFVMFNQSLKLYQDNFKGERLYIKYLHDLMYNLKHI